MRVVAFLGLCAVAFGAMGYVILAMAEARRFNPDSIVDEIDSNELEDEGDPQGFLLDAPVQISSLHDSSPESLSGFIARIKREEAERKRTA